MRKIALALVSAMLLAAGTTGCNTAGIAASAMHPLDNFGGVLGKKSPTTSGLSEVRTMDNFGGVLKKASNSTATTSAKSLDNFGGVL